MHALQEIRIILQLFPDVFSLCNLPLAVPAEHAVVDRDAEHEVVSQRTDVVGNWFLAVLVPSRQIRKVAHGIENELLLDIDVWEQPQTLRVHSVLGFARIQLGARIQYIAVRQYVTQQALYIVARCLPPLYTALSVQIFSVLRQCSDDIPTLTMPRMQYFSLEQLRHHPVPGQRNHNTNVVCMGRVDVQ